MMVQSELPSPLWLNPMRFPTPQARFEERVQLALGFPTILIVVWPDKSARSAAMKRAAASTDGMFIDCNGVRSREFLRILESRLAIPEHLSSFERYRAVLRALDLSSRPLFLDDATVFDRAVLRMLQDFYDHAGTTSVVGTSTPRLARLIDDRDAGGQLFSRSATCDLRS